MRKLYQAPLRLWQAFGKLFSENTLSLERFHSLLSAANHPAYLIRHRAAVINARIRTIALAFALLLLAWIPIDFLFLPPAAAADIALLRLLSSAVFVALTLSITATSRWTRARQRLLLLMATPLLFYLAVQWVFGDVEAGPLGTILIDIYNLLPFIVVAGLAIFPLTIVETVALGTLSLVVMALGPLLSAHFEPASYFPAAWILGLILATCVMASAIQLNYMSSLIHRVSTDHLTGAFTRQSGQELLDLYFQLSVEQGKPFAVAFVDLDHFKSINDRFGHEAGDQALVAAVSHLKAQLRRGDHVVRWGGEEFLVILTDADAEGVQRVLQRIVGQWLGQRPDGAPLTASIGVAERLADGAADWLSLIEVADRRMYRAKQSGRARAVTMRDEAA
jgi:diguanylate cyclase (GGDEF)-like protein